MTRLAVVGIFLLFLSVRADGQSKAVLKGKANIEAGKPEKALKSLSKYTEGKSGKKDIEAFLVLAEAAYETAKLPAYDAQREELIEKALKSISRANRKDKKLDFVTDYTELFFKVSEYGMEVADDLRKRQKYNKALPMAKMIAEQTDFPGVQVLIAKIELSKGDTLSAKERLRMNTEKTAEIFAKNERTAQEEREGFDMLIKLYRTEQKPDSLLDIAGSRINIYGTDAKLNQDLNWALENVMQSRVLDMTLMEDLDRWGPYFYCDTNYQRLHTAAFLYMFRQTSDNGLSGEAFNYFKKYHAAKSSAVKREGLQCFERGTLYDSLDGEAARNVYHYLARLRRARAAVTMLGIMADNELKYREPEKSTGWAMVFGWLERIKDDWGYMQGLNMAMSRDQIHRNLFAKHATVLERILRKELSKENREEQEIAIEIVDRYFKANKTLSNLANGKKVPIIRSYLNEGKPETAHHLSISYSAFLSKEKGWSDLLRNISEEDFRVNYFGTRVNEKDSAVKQWLQYQDAAQCKRGTVPAEVQALVQRRINYFRRRAGIPDAVQLTAARNKACQDAAAILAQLPRPTHTLAKSMRCYNPEAAEAARLGAINIGQNISLGITGVMADMGVKNEAVGNRRWLLFPGASEMGHGSLKSIGVYWLMDEVKLSDSMRYALNPVCWPPQGFVADVFNFSRWSISSPYGFENASVTMKAGGKEVKLKLLKPANGYGLPTIVWEPEKETADWNKPIEIEVKGIIIPGKKETQTYRYTMQFFTPRP